MADADAFLDEVEGESCICCLEGSEGDLRKLPCKHIICSECIEKLLEERDTVFQCPNCKIEHSNIKSELDVEVLRPQVKHITTDEQSDSEMRNGFLCTRCGKTGLVFCVDCKMIMCIKHNVSHDDLFPNHKKLSEMDYDMQKERHRTEFCYDHVKREATRICVKCYKLVCLDCAVTDSTKCDGVEVELPSVKVPSSTNFGGSTVKKDGGAKQNLPAGPLKSNASSSGLTASRGAPTVTSSSRSVLTGFHRSNSPVSSRYDYENVSTAPKLQTGDPIPRSIFGFGFPVVLPAQSTKQKPQSSSNQPIFGGEDKKINQINKEGLLTTKNGMHDFKTIDSETKGVKKLIRQNLTKTTPLIEIISLQEKAIRQRILHIDDTVMEERKKIDREVKRQISLLEDAAEQAKGYLAKHLEEQARSAEEYLHELKQFENNLEQVDMETRDTLENRGGSYLIRNKQRIVKSLADVVKKPLPDGKLKNLVWKGLSSVTSDDDSNSKRYYSKLFATEETEQE